MVDQQVCCELEATGSFGYMDLDVDEVEAVPVMHVNRRAVLSYTTKCTQPVPVVWGLTKTPSQL